MIPRHVGACFSITERPWAACCHLNQNFTTILPTCSWYCKFVVRASCVTMLDLKLSQWSNVLWQQRHKTCSSVSLNRRGGQRLQAAVNMHEHKVGFKTLKSISFKKINVEENALNKFVVPQKYTLYISVTINLNVTLLKQNSSRFSYHGISKHTAHYFCIDADSS